ncbi:uncharacterized protein TNCV_3252531 [Trichonephila clavipes]|nr:uncharacterized protein TNCV_3252531 [Trichonephila clavipes]
MKAYNLDPAWYYTAPSLSWDSMLKFTRVKIELLMDYDMYLFVEKGIRISQCSNRYVRANNKFLPNFEPNVDNIDENGEKGYILEVDLEYPESLHDDHSDFSNLQSPVSSVPPDVKKRDY